MAEYNEAGICKECGQPYSLRKITLRNKAGKWFNRETVKCKCSMHVFMEGGAIVSTKLSGDCKTCRKPVYTLSRAMQWKVKMCGCGAYIYAGDTVHININDIVLTPILLKHIEGVIRDRFNSA